MELQWLRYLNEMRQTSALALFLGTITLLPACIGISAVTDIGQKWGGNDLTFPPIALLLANLTQAVFSVTNIIVALGWLLLGKGSTPISLLNMVVTYLAWLPFLTVISLLAFTGDNFPQGMQPFIPMTLMPTESEVNSLTGFAIMGFVAYASNTVGALTFVATKLFFAQQVQGVIKYHRSYYTSRQVYYAFLTMLAGVTQLALGAYVQDKFGDNRLAEPIVAGPFTVSYPQISIAMGVLVAFHGVLLFCRAYASRDVQNSTGAAFDTWTVFMYLTVLAVQVLTQVAVAPAAAAGNASACYDTLALAVFPLYLDFKGRSTPDEMSPDHFCLTEHGPSKADPMMMPSA